jgi:hypothetical protein
VGARRLLTNNTVPPGLKAALCRACGRTRRRPRGAAMADLPGVGLVSLVWLVRLYALAVGVGLIELALRLRGMRRGLQGDPNSRGGNE